MQDLRKTTLAFDDLAAGNWRLVLQGRTPFCLAVEFRGDGSVAGLPEAMGQAWTIEGGTRLVVTRADGRRTLDFTDPFLFADEGRLTGAYAEAPEATPVVAWLQRMTPAFSFVDRWTAFLLRREIERHGWSIGAYTYGHPRIHEAGLAPLTIGRFCSIAEGVNIALANHRMDTVSTYPFQTLKELVQDWRGAPDEPDHATRGPVVIGSDVWIATGAFIAPGVRIGHGAVVGAGSVVTRDVPPYAVVAGNPARVIRHRFDPDTVARLLALAWWTWPAETIERNLPLMMRSDIEAFLAADH